MKDTKQLLEHLFTKHADGVPETLEELMEHDLYKEVSIDILKELCEATCMFKDTE